MGTLRARLVHEGDGLFLDAVIVGEGRDRVGALIVGDRAACAAHCGMPVGAAWEEVLAHPGLRDFVQGVLDTLAVRGTGSSTYVARAMMLHDAPSPAAGELTDKGSINQRTFLSNRPELVARLFADPAAGDVYVAAARLPRSHSTV